VPYCTFKVTEVLRIFDGLVPVITSVDVARGVELVVAIVSVDDPPPSTDAGTNVHDVFEGQPVRLNATASLKPPDGVTVTAYVTLLPRFTVRLVGDTAMVKSGTGTGLTVSVTIVDWMGEPLLSEAQMVTGNDPVGVFAVVVMVSVLEPDPPVNDVGEYAAAVFDGSPLSQ
jgi:hypothetical protein